MGHMKKDNRRFSINIIIVMMILLALLVAGSFISIHYFMRNVKTVRDLYDSSYTRHYAYIHTGEDSDFWNGVYNGASRQGETMGVCVQDFDKNLTVAYSFNELMQIAIDAQVDGLIIDGNNSAETIELINVATAADIPVVTVMNDAADSERITFVGISSYSMGRHYGEKIMTHVPASHKEDIKVDIFMNSDNANSGQSLIVPGISDVFRENGYGDQLRVEVRYVDNSSAFSAEEDIRDVFLRGELPDAVIGLNSVYTRCLFQAAVDYNKVGEVLIYGFGDSEEILEAVNKGLVEATISANTEEMGASAIMALDEYLNTGYVSGYLSQDTQMIEADKAQELLGLYAQDTE